MIEMDVGAQASFMDAFEGRPLQRPISLPKSDFILNSRPPYRLFHPG